MKTNRSSKIIVAGLFATALLFTQLTSQATTIVGPYTADANTLHLWHMNTGVPVLDAVATGGTNLVNISGGATLSTSSFSGFGTALNTIDGGQTVTTLATGKDALLSATAAAGNTTIQIADPTTGAFTWEAIVWIGFNPTLDYTARSTTCQIVSGDSQTAANRSFQFKISPIGLIAGVTVPALAFNNLRASSASQPQMYAAIPTTGPDAILSNNWYHVAVTYNGSPSTADNFRFYWTLLDGSRTNANQIATTSTTTMLTGLNPISTVTTPFMIGNEGRNKNANFLGVIDEVRISSVARGSNEMIFTGPVIIASQPADQSVGLGQAVNISVRAAGSDPLTYQWRLYGTNLPGATTSAYPIAAAQPTDAGPYDVIVSNDFGAITSSVATLTVGSPVSITSQPAGQTVAVGWSASFSVTAGGASPFSYQWRLYGTNVPGATQNPHLIASAQLTDAGPYDVVVTNNYGAVTSDVATLTVRTPLNLTWIGSLNPDWDTSSLNWLTDTSVAFATGDNVTFDLNGSGQPIVNLTGPLSPSAVLVNASTDYTLSSSVGGGIAGVAGLTKSGAGTLVVDTDNSYSGPTLIQGGIVQLGAADAHGSLGTGPITNNTAIVVNRTGAVSLGNTLTGPGSLTNLLGGTITISGTNTLSGPITFNAGMLSLVGPQSAGNSTDLTFNASVNSTTGTRLSLSGGVTLSSDVTLSMLGTTDSPDARCTVITASDGSTNILNGPIVVGGSGSVQFLTGTGELDINGSVSVPDFTGKLILRGNSGVGHVYSTINLPSAIQVSKTDAGTWIIHSTGNSWTNSNLALGTVRLAANNALPPGLILSHQGTLDLAGFNQQIGGLTSTAATGIITNTSTTADSTLTLATAEAWTFTGVIKDSAAGGTGKVGLTLAGGGTLTLTGVSTYTGDTIISAGTLALSGAGSLNSTFGTISIAAGATFDVSGVTTTPPYHVRTGKTLSGGGGATIVGPLVENGGGFLALTYVSGTPAINVTGGELTLNGCATTVTVSGPALGIGNYKLISASAGGSVAGTLPASVTVGGSGLAANTTASLSLTSGELWLDVVTAVVPQPVITTFSYDGANLILSGTNGIEGNTYYVLASTNVAAPLSNWEPVFTNTFEANGVFSVTNAVSPTIPALFYLLQLP